MPDPVELELDLTQYLTTHFHPLTPYRTYAILYRYLYHTSLTSEVFQYYLLDA